MYRRRSVLAPRGLVTSPHALATAAGLRALQGGGNAVEAAIAAAATIAVVYPHMNGLGGDNIWLIYDASAQQVRALLACGTAGSGCTIDAYRAAGHAETIPRRGPLAANTVPGVVDGWAEAYRYSREHMRGRLPFASLLDDALYYAEAGFPVTAHQAAWTGARIGPDSGPFGHLEHLEGWRRTFLRPDGSAYGAGERFTSPDLAATLRAIARGGRDAFYRGPIAARICTVLRERGGVLQDTDFAAYRCRWADPLTLGYREWTVCNTPPPTQGLTSLEILNIVEHFPLAAWGGESPDYYHVLVEAAKQAFADRDDWIADPDYTSVPVPDLLSKTRGRAQAAAITFDRAVAPESAARPAPGDTVFLAAVDVDGNAVSLIQSIYFDFGSAVVAEGTGVLLQNRGSAFSLDPADLNVLAPGKRPFTTLNPALALRDGRPVLVYGAMGGEGQPQTQAAILTRVLDLGMDVQAAIDGPRWLYGRTWGEPTTALSLESRVPPHVVDDLRRRGHDVRVVGPWDDLMGHAQAIWIDRRTGTRCGGADPRGDGIAAGY
ncbi:MAG TPA: gamma-glutamyltransferase [bacterium]|nr:gamma-glutamyltransferase [bacterium]